MGKVLAGVRILRRGAFGLLVALCAASLLLFSGCSRSAEQDTVEWGRADAKEIDVNTKVAGRVVELLVKEGDQVKEGQVIARIDDRDLLTQKAQVEADIAAIEAQGTQASAVTRMQSGTTASQLQEAQAAAGKAAADLELAASDYARYRELVAAGAVSQQVYEQQLARYRVAERTKAQADAAVASASSALTQNDVNRANEEAVARNLDQAKAKLAQIEVALSETEIHAPFDGVITKKYVEEGSMLSLGTPLVAVQDSQDNWVDIKVPETELSRFALGDTWTLLARDGKTEVTGTVTDVSQKAEFATQRATSERGDATDIVSYNVKLQTDSPAIRPGMRFRLEGL